MIPGPLRFYCGRPHRRPLLVVLLDHLGWHRELYRIKGETVVRSRWVAARRPGRSVYTCRLPASHWRATIKPEGTKKMQQIPLRNTVKSSRRPIFRAGEAVTVEVPTASWEIGHRYEFTRWEEV